MKQPAQNGTKGDFAEIGGVVWYSVEQIGLENGHQYGHGKKSDKRTG
jgi:hypothetical protein